MIRSPQALDSWRETVSAVQACHDRHDLRGAGGGEPTYRIARMTEELGEVSSCITKDRATVALAEGLADLLILVMGTGIANDLDLNPTLWKKMDRPMEHESRVVNGRIRVSDFRYVD